jgi:hypothetical protein
MGVSSALNDDELKTPPTPSTPDDYYDSDYSIIPDSADDQYSDVHDVDEDESQAPPNTPSYYDSDDSIPRTPATPGSGVDDVDEETTGEKEQVGKKPKVHTECDEGGSSATAILIDDDCVDEETTGKKIQVGKKRSYTEVQCDDHDHDSDGHAKCDEGRSLATAIRIDDDNKIKKEFTYISGQLVKEDTDALYGRTQMYLRESASNLEKIARFTRQLSADTSTALNGVHTQMTAAFNGVHTQIEQQKTEVADQIQKAEDKIRKDMDYLNRRVEEMQKILECPERTVLNSFDNMAVRQLFDLLYKLGPNTDASIGSSPMLLFTTYRDEGKEKSITVISKAITHIVVNLVKKRFCPAPSTKFLTDLSHKLDNMLNCIKLSKPVLNTLQLYFPVASYQNPSNMGWVMNTEEFAGFLLAVKQTNQQNNTFASENISNIQNGSKPTRKIPKNDMGSVLTRMLDLFPEASKEELWDHYTMMLDWGRPQCSEYVSSTAFQTAMGIIQSKLGIEQGHGITHVGKMFLNTNKEVLSLDELLKKQFGIDDAQNMFNNLFAVAKSAQGGSDYDD